MAVAKEPFQMTVHELHKLLKKKKISSAELTRSVFQRIDAVEHDVHAYITLTRDLALKQAAAADSRIKQEAVAPVNAVIDHVQLFLRHAKVLDDLILHHLRIAYNRLEAGTAEKAHFRPLHMNGDRG